MIASDKLIGVVGLDLQLVSLTEKISAIEVGYKGYPIILDTEGTAITHRTLLGENLMDLPFIAEMYEEGNEKGAIYYEHEGVSKVNIYSTIPKNGWKIGAIYDEKNIIEMATDLRKSMPIVALATLLVMFTALYFMISRTPIGKLNSLMDSVSQGDLTVNSNIKTKDEIGELMIDNMNAYYCRQRICIERPSKFRKFERSCRGNECIR